MLVLVLAHLMAPLHSSLPWLTLKGQCSFHIISRILNEYMVKYTICFKAPASTTEDAIPKATLANRYLSTAGNTDLAQFNYTLVLLFLQYHKP